MKKVWLLLGVALLLMPAGGRAEVGINLNINLGDGGAVPVVIEEPPVFLLPARLGFSVAVGVPYDMVFIEGRYYLYRGNIWHVAPRYSGPWVVVGHDHLPYGLRKHKYREIVLCRDEEYRYYKRDRDHYRGHVHHPGKGHGKGKGRKKHEDDDSSDD
ncbi:hypothetical protein DESUT3_00570 [Desulfuromonas versatilis]|uniref:Uncharacterized protein n=1 Tax=Desulfuromonas versatilis TaxID=2802975 RepID=A0ABN6DRY8_9BACT|nr:hypothetical protein [Desulfuromonas versatilis]BCR02988.1 hypothetical protein DESUT3_00570 [Desulfuromonas versatilis]